MDLLTYWRELTDAQAQIISTLLTGVGLIIGAWFGGGIVGHQVKRSKEALKRSANEEIAKIQELVAAIQIKTNELQAIARDSEGEQGAPAASAEQTAQPLWKELYATWELLRDRLEKIAADERIDGRTRAKYARIDRRSYYSLLNALADDKVIGPERQDWSRAIALWYANRRAVTAEGVKELRDLQNKLAPT